MIGLSGRALVLGGGGVTGIAWELGMLAGLADAGVDLTDADLVVGTSAGSVVGAQIRSRVALRELYDGQLTDPDGEIAARIGVPLLLRYAGVMLRSRDPGKFRRRIGTLALRADTVPESERRAVIADRLPEHDWPGRRLLITAVDAGSGEFTVFSSASKVSLLDAVSASCAVPGVWPPITIGQRRYIDGGMRAGCNIDLAAGHDRIVVLAPIPRGVGPLISVADQVAELDPYTRVTVVSPDAAARTAIGRNVLNPARRPGSARAGLAQARGVADVVAAVWTG